MEKSWNSGKWQNNFPDLEKSWILKKRPRSWNFEMHHGKIMEFCFLRFSRMLLLRFFGVLHTQLVISIPYRSWKKQWESWKFNGKIMEFHFGKWLETLSFLLPHVFLQLVLSLLPPTPTVEVIESVSSVCVRLSAVSWLNRLWYRQEIWHVGRPWPYLGQDRWARSRSPGEKMWFLGNSVSFFEPTCACCTVGS